MVEDKLKKILKGELSAGQNISNLLNRINEKNKEWNIFLYVNPNALNEAKIVDEKIKKGKAGKLAGLGIGIKANINVIGMPISCASKTLEDYYGTFDADVVEKIKKEDGIILGILNCDEFACGSSGEYSAFGPVTNPSAIGYVPGGSSAGSAAAIAANMADLTLGSDTGGSIRQPSAFCGTVGLKPTYGAVSRYGLMAAVSSFDQIGPISKTVDDVEIIFNAIKGKDKCDGTTIDEKTYPMKRIGKDKPIIGIPRLFLNLGGIDTDVSSAFNNAEKKLRDAGYEVKDIVLPMNEHALPVYYILNFAEVSSNLARYDGVKYGLHVDGKDVIDDYFETRRAGFGKESIRRILLGTYVLSAGYHDAYYNRANAVRRMITDDFIKAFESVDVVATPTTPAPAFKIGEKANDPVAMYLEDIFTVTANLTGMPAISIPCGTADRDGKKMPLGLQLTARHGDEGTLFEVGKEMEM